MNTTEAEDEQFPFNQEKPGALLEALREKKGFTQEYIASRLHLRVQVITLLEKDEYTALPEPVFLKGYIRAYAKLLDVPVEPILASFANHYTVEKKPEKTVWQNKCQTRRNELLIRLFTVLFAVSTLFATGLWWYKNKGISLALTIKKSEDSPKSTAASTKETSAPLTSVATLSSLFSAPIKSDKLATGSHSG